MTTAASTKTLWAIDPAHSEITFKVRHMMITSVRGHFESFSANIVTEGNDFNTAAVEVRIDVDSIRTKNADRDAHLKSDDFFNAETFPQITFTSKSFNGSQLVGDLTIRDVTKEVVLEVSSNGVAVDPYGQTKAGFEIVGSINRKEFGLKWDAVTEAGSVVVSDKVELIIDAQFVKQ